MIPPLARSLKWPTKDAENRGALKSFVSTASEGVWGEQEIIARKKELLLTLEATDIRSGGVCDLRRSTAEATEERRGEQQKPPRKTGTAQRTYVEVCLLCCAQ